MSLLRVLKKYAAIYFVQIQNNWVREVVYRTNFITSMFVDLVWIVVEFILFTVIYANTDKLGGWTKYQVYFFLGVLFSSDALFTIFFTRNMWQFSDLVNKGELDIMLTKPVSSLFLALTRWINITAVSNLALGLAIAIRFSGPAGFAGGIAWLAFPLWIAVGVCAALALRFLFCVCVFWTERSWALARMYYQFFGFATKPDSIYPKAIRYLIKTALPFALIGSIPARALMEGLSVNEGLLVFIVLATFFVVDTYLWKEGLKRYQSASS